MDKAKPFDIPKREVWEAFKRVKANQGAAGVDGQSIAEFEANLSGNLYKLWNRMSSGSYLPVPIQRSSHIGASCMSAAEHRKPCESRGLRTVLGARGGEIPPRDSPEAEPSRSVRFMRREGIEPAPWGAFSANEVCCANDLAQPLSYSSWRRHHGFSDPPSSFLPHGARSRKR